MKRILVLGSLLGLLVSAAVAGSLALVGDSPQSTAGSNRIRIVKSPADSLPLPDSELDSRGVRIFGSWSDARAAVDETTKAIIVTDSALSSADSQWIRDEVHAGMVIGAFDVSSASVAQALGLHGQLPAPEGVQLPTPPALETSRFGGETVFSLILDVQSGGRVRRGGFVEKLGSTDQFLAHVERYIANAAGR
jgi:hypothetical protein